MEIDPNKHYTVEEYLAFEETALEKHEYHNGRIVKRSEAHKLYEHKTNFIMPQIFTTKDGSHSLESDQFGEAYHSRHGALQESLHVFIDAGLKSILEGNPSKIKIFEMGLGTGLNALLTYLHCKDLAIPVEYWGIELYPIDNWKDLNYPELLENSKEAKNVLNQMHEAAWNIETNIDPNFTLHKIQGKLEETTLPDDFFNLVYFDAFAPNAQPELWTEEIFAKLFEAMVSDGLLTTYCAKGVVKRAMKAVGFSIEGIPGPPGKREMTIARKHLKQSDTH